MNKTDIIDHGFAVEWMQDQNEKYKNKSSFKIEYCPEYERLHRELAEAQSQKQPEQLERLRKDMRAVPMETAVPADAPELGGPSDLIFTHCNPDEAEEDIDSDSDDIDRMAVIEESKEASAFKNFLKERREINSASFF